MAEILYYAGIDLQQNEIKNGVIHNAGTAPLSPVAGQQYFNTGSNKLYVFDGTDWVDMSTHTISNVVVDATYTTLADYITNVYDPANFAEGDVLILSTATDPEQRSWINLGTNTGTATDFSALSSAYDSAEIKALFSAGTGLSYADGVYSITNSGVDTTQLADDSVTASKINVDVAGDGLVPNGTTGALDVNADGSTLEIATDTLQVKDAGITQAKLDATLAGKIVNGYAETVGDGTATSFTITHNLNTNDIMTQMYKISTGECVECTVQRTSVNAISLGAFPAPASNDLRVMVTKLITA